MSVCVACGIALFAAAPAAAQPPSLAGESFVATGDLFFLPPGATPGEVQVSGACDPNGTSTFTFHATGPAFGPYPGTFDETGTFTMVGPPVTEDLLVLTGFQAEFTINSTVGQVEGTKSFTGAVPGASTTCRAAPLRVFSGLAPTHYEAMINTTAGAFATEGEANSSLGYEEAAPGNPLADYSESFLTGTPPVELPPNAPTDKEACKKGGFKTFPELGFKNQGDCVSFVATKGTNEPGKNVPGLP